MAARGVKGRKVGKALGNIYSHYRQRMDGRHSSVRRYLGDHRSFACGRFPNKGTCALGQEQDLRILNRTTWKTNQRTGEIPRLAKANVGLWQASLPDYIPNYFRNPDLHVYWALLLTLRHSVMLEQAAKLDPRGANGFFALDMGTIFIFTIAIVVAIAGVSTALLDTRPKLEEQIAKYDKNITDLKEILRQRLEKIGRHGWVRRKAGGKAKTDWLGISFSIDEGGILQTQVAASASAAPPNKNP
jgi:hypothetical protein